jgi:phosphatidate cytidylyltransferase
VKQRVLTAIVLAPIVLGAVFISNPWPLIILAALCAYIAGREISGLIHKDSHVAGALSAALVALAGALALPAWLFGFAAAIGIVATWLGAKNLKPWFVPLALLWSVGPLLSLVRLHGVPAGEWYEFASPVLLALLPLWGGDTAAIFAGKAFGRHPLAPAISPKKTWEGSIANLLACVAVGYVVGECIGQPAIVGIGSGVIAGLFGQAGDLFESYIKRQADVKDSGTILPGHGGLLDRIDSLLFTAPLVLLLVDWFATRSA